MLCTQSVFIYLFVFLTPQHERKGVGVPSTPPHPISKAWNIKRKSRGEVFFFFISFKGMWGCIWSNSYPWPCLWFIREPRRGEKKKKKKLITPTDGYPIQRKCQKDSYDSQSTCERERGRFTDGYVSREMMESPSQMSLYHLIFRDKTICVCWKQLRALPFVLGCFFFIINIYLRR